MSLRLLKKQVEGSSGVRVAEPCNHARSFVHLPFTELGEDLLANCQSCMMFHDQVVATRDGRPSAKFCHIWLGRKAASQLEGADWWRWRRLPGGMF